MNFRNCLIALGLAFSFNAQAQVDSYAFGFSPRTGDVWMDAQLGDMNVYSRGDRNGFIDDVVVSFGAPRYVVNEYIVDRRWAPGDVYYGCALAYQLRVPCLNVLRDYDKNHGQGWGVIAKRMGIKPGSAAFHALKGNVDKSNGKFKTKSKGNSKGSMNMHNGNDHGPGNSNKGGKSKDSGNPGKGKEKKGKGH